MEARAGTVTSLHAVLETMETLGEDELRVVVARAQGLLLDGADPRSREPALSVEIVDDAESMLLCRYRALPPPEQRRLLGRVRADSRMPRRLAPRAAALA